MLIDPTQDAKAVSVDLVVGSTLQIRGTLGLDVIAIEIPDGAGSWESLIYGGNVVQLDTDNRQITAYGKTLIRVNKPETTNSVGVAKIG